MRLSNRQALILFEILQHSLHVYGGVAGFSNKTLTKLYEDILNQQSSEVVDLESEEGENHG